MSRTLIRGGRVVTMVPGQPPARADVLVDGALIAAVGPSLSAADAEVIDARDRIVLPGMVESHRHTWQSSLRAVACDWTLSEYFSLMRGRLGPHFRPEDVYAGTLLGMTDALDAGITTVLDWSHNLSTPDHADAAWQALRDAGSRAVLAYGSTNDQALRPDDSRHTRDVERMRATVAAAGDGPLSLAVALRGPEFSSLDATEADWRFARSLDLPITVHVGGGLRGARGTIRQLAERGLLGPDTTYVHGNMLGDDELELIASSGGRVSVAPEVESNMGHGPVALGRLLGAGIRPGLSADVCTNVGSDLFTTMRVALALGRGADHAAALARGEQVPELSLRACDVLAMVTTDGARACGLDDRIGTLEPGKQADVVLIDASAINVAPVDDPIAAVVSAADRSNVDTALVAGVVRKRAGRLVGVDVGRVLELARASREHLLRASGLGTSDAGRG